MKAWLFFVLGILLIGSVGAISTDLKENYQPRETMVFEISGNILEPIKQEDVVFMRRNVVVPLNFDVKNLGGNYFIWAIAPLNESNYTLVIKDLATTGYGVKTKIDYMQNFSVSGNIADYSVTPGFVLAKEKFDLEIFLYEDEERVVSVNYPELHEIILKPGKNKFSFPVSSVFGTRFFSIDLGAYSLPAYITGTANNAFESQSSFLYFDPVTIYREVEIDEEVEYVVVLENRNNESIDDIELEYNDDLFDISPRRKFSLDPDETIEVTISLKDPFSGVVDEVVYARSGETSVAIPVGLVVKDDERENNNSGSSGFYCEELSGNICGSNEECIGSSENSIQGSCCLGTCREVKEDNSSSLIGWLLLGIVVLGVAVLFVKYKRTKKPISTGKKIPVGKKVP